MSYDSVRLFSEQVSRFKYLVLMCSLLLLVGAYPIIHEVNKDRHWFDLLFCVVLAASVPAVGRRRTVVLIAAAIAVPAVVSVVANELTADGPHRTTPGLVLAAALMIYTAAAILIDIFKNERVTSDTICGAICVYLLLGVTWALLYQIVAIHSPDAFKGLDRESEFYDFVYYSFVTITTLGYGDMTPVSPPARMLSSLEALLGQLFIAVLIARFVGLHGRTIRSDR